MRLTAPSKGIAVDAAHSMKDKMTEYRGVDLETGEILFHRRLGNQTVNIGEFLAVVDAVKELVKRKAFDGEVWTDSLTAVSWFRCRSASSVKRNLALQKAVIYLKFMGPTIRNIRINHWNTRLWGEIPADFGRK